MLKNFGALLLLFALLTQTFHKAVIVSGYYANTADYAKNCINKAKPQLHCNGKCQMMKKLKQEDKKDQQNPERRSSSKDEVLSSKSFFASIDTRVLIASFVFDGFSAGKPVKIAATFFHPPGA